MSMAKRLTSLLEANYPERLQKVVIAPVPSLAKTIVDGMLWFLPERTRAKFSVASNSEEVAEALHVDLSTLPAALQDLVAFEEDRMAAGVVTTTVLEDGSEQWTRSMEIPAGRSVTVSSDITKDVATMEFSLTTRAKSKLPGVAMIAGVFNSNAADVQLTICFVPDPERPAEKPFFTGRVTELRNHVWQNEFRQEGKMQFTLNNEHARHLTKTVQLLGISRLDLAAADLQKNT